MPRGTGSCRSSPTLGAVKTPPPALPGSSTGGAATRGGAVRCHWQQSHFSNRLFMARLGWAVRPLAAGEPLVAHPQHNASAGQGCPSAGGQRTIGRPRTKTAEYHARRMRRDSKAPKGESRALVRAGLLSTEGPAHRRSAKTWDCPGTGLAARASSSATLQVRNRPSFPLVAPQHPDHVLPGGT
jgi:hypothetical protein